MISVDGGDVHLHFIYSCSDLSLGQTSAPCNDHPDCTDPATTCQVMRIPKKDNGIFAIGLQKRCVCTEPLRAVSFNCLLCTAKKTPYSSNAQQRKKCEIGETILK